MEMERGGTGGFHGYRRPPQTSSGNQSPEISRWLRKIQTKLRDNVETSGVQAVYDLTASHLHTAFALGFHAIPAADITTYSHSTLDLSLFRSLMGMELREMNIRLPEINNYDNHHSTADGNECIVREQDRFMPIANVIRIMRKILPPQAKIADDAKETIQECVSEFISFVTGEANERCQREQRKTITAEDVLWAMSKLGFDDYIEPLTVYLTRYRELEGDRSSIRGEPLVKRGVDLGALNVAAFAPAAFHLGHPPQGFFGAVAMGGLIPKDNGSNEGSSQAAVGNIEPYAQFNN